MDSSGTAPEKTRGNHGGSWGQSDTPGKKMDEVRLYSDELEEITDAEVPLDIRSEVPRIPGMLPKVITGKETVTIKVNPIVKQRPDEIGAGLSDGADGLDIGSVNVIVCPPRREHQEMGAMMKMEELFSDGCGVGQNQMAKETSVGTLMVIKDDLIVKPGPSPVIVDVSEETRTNEGTTEVCVFDNLCRNETTKREVSTELLDISRQWIPQGFLRLDEEAKFVGVGNTPSGMMIEVLPEIAEVTGPTSESISWKIKEDSDESAVSLGEVMREVTSIRFDVGQLMRWPDRNSDDKLICEFRLESELFTILRGAKPSRCSWQLSLKYLPQFLPGGSLLSQNPRLWQRQLHREFLFCWKQIPDRSVCGCWRRRPVVFKLG